MTDPDLDILRLRAAYRAGRRPADVVRAVYRRIAEVGDPGIFITLIAEAEAVAAADALGGFDEGLPLWGIPFAVKDNIDVAGLPTTAGCPDFAYVPKRSAFVVEQLLAAGAILIGKTNLDQFAAGLVGVRTPYPVPRNVVDPKIVPGGSSSGSAVAVAHGIVSFALGTDTAGSGRVPAALNGIVGLKPTRGMLSAAGVIPACRTLDCVSVFAGTMAEAWQVAGVAAVYDANDAYARPVALGAMKVPGNVRLGVPDAASLIVGSETARRAFAAAVAALPETGSEPRPIDMTPFYGAAKLLYEGPWVAERYAAIREFITTRPEALFPVTRTIIESAQRFSAADAFDGRYALAEFARKTEGVWRDIDVLVVPSIPDVCTVAEVAADPLVPNRTLGTYTNFVNLLDLCAVTVPSVAREDGLPGSVTLIAPAGRDGLLAALGAMIHAGSGVPIGATGRLASQTEAAPPSPSANAIPLAVVGAHLSGMALNRELTDLGAIFVKAAATAPAYRLFALPGGPPHRPGLVRVANGSGAAIDVEVWALNPEALGSFLARIPAPLGIGTVNLADGSSVKGFLCEGVATEGARDITSFGGWRSYFASIS